MNEDFSANDTMATFTALSLHQVHSEPEETLAQTPLTFHGVWPHDCSLCGQTVTEKNTRSEYLPLVLYTTRSDSLLLAATSGRHLV